MNKKLPEGWKWVKLSDAVLIFDNLRKPINASERQKRINSKSEEELYPYYGATGQVGWIDDYLTQGEYVLVGEDGAPFLDVYKNKAYKIKGKTWVNNHAHILQEKLGLTVNDYILYYLNSVDYRQYVNGTTRLKLTKSSLSEIKFPLSPLPTQQAIVSKIEELFSELDKGIENLKTAQQQLKVYRQSVLKWAFEGKLTNGLNHDSFDLHDENDLNQAAEPKAVYQSAKHQENQANQKNHSADKEHLPEEWKWKRLGDMFNFIGGGTPSKSEKTYWNGSIPWASVKDIKGDYLEKPQDTITEKGLKNSASNLANEGDVILITRISPGKAIITNIVTAVNQDLKIVKPKFKTTSKFVKYFFNAIERDCVKISSGTTVLGITLNNLNELLIPDLTIKEQTQIVQEIESRLSVADKMEETIQQSLLKAESLRQSILKKAFEGELVK